MRKRFKKRPYTIRIPSIEVDQFNKQTLKAIYVKLVRDYVGFFGGLQKLYGQSKQRKRIDETISKIRKTITFLRNILNVGTISKKDAEILTSNIEEINEDKDYFLEQAQSVRAFRERVSKVAETTGISLEDLTVTKEIVKKGVKQARIGTRKRPSVLRGAMPETRKTVKGLVGGAAVAALGPFTPFAGMAYGAAKDVLGLGRRVGRFGIERVRERRTQRIGRQLQPLAQRILPEDLERTVSERGRGFPLSGIRGVRGISPLGRQGIGRVATRRSKEEASASLMYFFDKKAHKAKWTRTILKWIKESAKPRRGILGGLISGFKNLLPLMVAAGLAFGKIALVGAAVAVVVAKLLKLSKLTGEYFDVLKNVKDFEKKQFDVVTKIGEKYATAALFGKTLEERAAGKRAGLQIRKAEEERYREEAKGWGPRALTKQWRTGVSGIRSEVSGIRSGVSGLIGAGATRLGLRPRTEFAPSGVSTLPSMEAPREVSQSVESIKAHKELVTAMNNVEEAVKKEKEVAAIRQAGLGDIHDSGDVLLNEAANGGLSIGD